MKHHLSFEAHGAAAAIVAPPATARRRPLRARAGAWVRDASDRAIGAFSLVSNDPVLDVRDFEWTRLLRDNWQAIRDEALATAPADPSRPALLWECGAGVAENLRHCPRTHRVVARIPDLDSAFVSVLAPGTHVPPHRGASKGLLTCHLGLVVPRDGDVRMRVRDRVVRWAVGETLLFDDTCDHEVWNDTSGARLVLQVHVRRPLRQPGKWVADAVLDRLRRRAFAQEARGDMRVPG
ncbi:aspartyl/asparaginyl beta-hydroxylase domain-containing protein [Sphingomonas sp.]|uniref:aspartyl/asparaginyl beta-hydroxylase domain-containing protein n=1 Tax=Sphingomonas sp. TaxID=28214 RepID=UPI0025EE280A|nr:aspartyl/asparaginyl beta-hydroxylase domain-containing protein [Sphingomonas sp.]